MRSSLRFNNTDTQAPRHSGTLTLCHFGTLTLIFLLTGFNSLWAQTEVEGSVRGFWNAEGSPYIATGALTVADGQSLRIESGIEVLFRGDFTFSVLGRLEAIGVEGDSITFTTAPEVEGWGGLRLMGADSLTRLDYCVITNGRQLEGGEIDSAASGGNLFIWGGEVLVEHSRISRGQARSIGGGVAIWRASPVFRNCLINENTSSNFGGGAGIIFQSHPIFENCRIIENVSANGGGGMFINNHSHPEIQLCRFELNNTIGRNGSGGGMFISNQSNPVIEHCQFVGNISSGQGADGGAVAVRYTSLAEFYDCTFDDNESSDSGGAMYLRGEGTNPLFDHCVFTRNTVRDGDFDGGAVYIRERSGAEIRYCRFIENATNWGGALSVREPARCNIHHNLFKGNGSLRGGSAVMVADDLGQEPLIINNCTFIDQNFTGLNPVPLTAYAHGNSRIRIINSIIWDDLPHFRENSRISVLYSHIKEGYEGEGNSGEDPQFFKPDSIWCVLYGHSPCIDSGDPESPADPDGSHNDRGWLYFPHNALEGLETDTLTCELTIVDRDTVQLRFRNETDVPLFLSPMDNWIPGIREALVNVTGIIGDGLINGVAWTENGFFLSGSNNGQSPNKIYRMDRNFNLFGNFDQPGDRGGYGFLDLATDGIEVLYGGNDRQIIEFITNGEFGFDYDIHYEMDPHIEYIRAIGADFSHAHRNVDFYFSGDEGFIIRANADMWEQDRIDLDDVVLGMGVKGNSRALYIVTEPAPGKHLLSLILPDEQRTIPLYTLRAPENHHLGGIEITQNWDDGRGTLIGIYKGEGEDGDKLFVEDLYTSWLVIVPELKLVMPGEEVEWNIVFAGDQMPVGSYNSVFSLTINGIGDDSFIPASMDLRPESVSKNDLLLPQAINLGGIYPNPFNSNARFTYSLRNAGLMNLVLIDNHGRVVSLLEQGFMQAGRYNGCLNARLLPSGSYFLRLASGGKAATTRLIVIK